MKKQSNLSRLLEIAGNHKYLTYASWVLSAISALIALVPFYYIWKMIKEVLEVAPDFGQAQNLTGNGWMAVLFAVLAVLVYIAGLMCSHLGAFRIATNLRIQTMEHIVKLPLGFAESFGSGKLRKIVNESSAATETYLAHQLPDRANAIATPCGLLVLLFVFDWRLGLLSLVPVVLGSSRHNQGVQPLIDAVIDYLPCPTDIPPARGIHIKKDREEEVSVPCDVTKPALGLVFKIQYDKEMGSLAYVRMYSGKIASGTQLLNINKKKRERVNRILRMHADKSEALTSVEAGDIAVFVGLKLAQTGDSVGSEGFPVLLEKPVFPQPVISVALEPESMSERDKMNETLELLSKEDPTFTYHEDEETGQLIISGMGELHLDVLVTRMKDDFGVKCRVGNPQVTYRESVTAAAEVSETFEKVLAGKENKAGLAIKVEPRETGSGNSYSCTVRHLLYYILNLE